MYYAVNQFGKLINSQNILESDQKHKERCLYLKVNSISIINYCIVKQG